MVEGLRWWAYVSREKKREREKGEGGGSRLLHSHLFWLFFFLSIYNIINDQGFMDFQGSR